MTAVPPDPAPDPYIAVRCVGCEHLPSGHPYGGCSYCKCDAYTPPTAAYLADYNNRLREAQARFMEGGDAA